jgi:hypothetical protein
MIEDAFKEVKKIATNVDNGGSCCSDGTTNGCVGNPLSNYYYWAGMACNCALLTLAPYDR